MAGLFGFAFVIAGATLIFKRVGELAGLVEQFKEALGYKAMEEILSRSKVTAVVATDDMLAFGANLCLTQKNRQEIALVGFNNTLLAEYQKPPLTSIDINAEKIGYYTAKLLVDRK